MLNLQKIAQLQRKKQLIMGAEFITFDNAVNDMVHIIQRCGLSGGTQNFFISFLLPAVIRCADYWAEIRVGILDNHSSCSL